MSSDWAIIRGAIVSAIHKSIPDDPSGHRARAYLMTTLVDGFANYVTYDTMRSRHSEPVDMSFLADILIEKQDSMDRRTLYELSYVAPLAPATYQVQIEPRDIPQMWSDIIDGQPAKVAIRDLSSAGYSRVEFDTTVFELLNWAPPGLFDFIADQASSHDGIRFARDSADRTKALALRTVGARDRILAPYRFPEDTPDMPEAGRARVIASTGAYIARHGLANLAAFYGDVPEHLRHVVGANMTDIKRLDSGIPVPEETVTKMAWDCILAPSTRPETRWLNRQAIQIAIMNDDDLLTSLAHQVFVPHVASPARPRLVDVNGEKRPTRLSMFQKATVTSIGHRIIDRDNQGTFISFNTRYGYIAEGIVTRRFVRAVYEKAVSEGIVTDGVMEEEHWVLPSWF